MVECTAVEIHKLNKFTIMLYMYNPDRLYMRVCGCFVVDISVCYSKSNFLQSYVAVDTNEITELLVSNLCNYETTQTSLSLT